VRLFLGVLCKGWCRFFQTVRLFLALLYIGTCSV